MRTAKFCLVVLFAMAALCSQAWAEVSFLCLVRPQNGAPCLGGPPAVRVRFATGQELRRSYNDQNVSDTEIYVMFPNPYGGLECQALNRTVLFVSDQFDQAAFIRLFEQTGQIEVRGRNTCWLVVAKDPSLMKNPWIDPTLNR